MHNEVSMGSKDNVLVFIVKFLQPFPYGAQDDARTVIGVGEEIVSLTGIFR
jgi:hypothetical protein